MPRILSPSIFLLLKIIHHRHSVEEHVFGLHKRMCVRGLSAGRVCPPQKSAQNALVKCSLVCLGRPIKTSNWPIFDRQSTEFIKTNTLVCVLITVPGCSGHNMIESGNLEPWGCDLRCRPGFKQTDPMKELLTW